MSGGLGSLSSKSKTTAGSTDESEHTHTELLGLETAQPSLAASAQYNRLTLM